MLKYIDPIMILCYIVITGYYIIELVKDGVTSIRLQDYLVVAVLLSAIAYRIRIYMRGQ